MLSFLFKNIAPLHITNIGTQYLHKQSINVNILDSEITTAEEEKNKITDKNILKAAVFERHKETGKTGFGFIKGFNIKKGAIATTVSHDAHNLLVLGTNDEDMSLAANIIKNAGGGLTAVADGKELATVELPLAGLMSEAPIEEMEKKVAALSNAWKELGCDLPSPFMTMSILALACLPELKLTNRRLIDCVRFEKVPLIIEN